jgi:hypothetical protein
MDLEKLKQLINEIEQDCFKLKREGHLTEFGQGQLELIKIIKIQVKNG